MNLEFLRVNDNEHEIAHNDKIAGVFRFYEDPDFSYAGIKLTRFLGYIRLEPEFRRLGILRRIIEEFNIKSLMVDDIEDVDIDTLKRIYQRLGFRSIEGSERFMIRD